MSIETETKDNSVNIKSKAENKKPENKSISENNTEAQVIPVPEEIPQINGMLISRLDYPVTIKYGDNQMRISPRAKINKINKNILSDLPQGIVFVEKQ